MHRALADAQRRRIVDVLESAPDGLDAPALADELGLHPNTIRWHLAILTDAGLVSGRPGERTTPGRPRIVYSLDGSDEDGGAEGYRFLATLLTGALSELEDGPVRALTAGRAWGRYLVRRPPHPRTTPEKATEAVVGLLAAQGFRPEAAGNEIRMHACPFRELAETGPQVVCSIHRGLIDGALAELRSGLEVERLDTFVEPELCVARLHRAAAGEPAAR